MVNVQLYLLSERFENANDLQKQKSEF